MMHVKIYSRFRRITKPIYIDNIEVNLVNQDNTKINTFQIDIFNFRANSNTFKRTYDDDGIFLGYK